MNVKNFISFHFILTQTHLDITGSTDLFEKHQFTEYEEKVWKKLCDQESE